MTRFLDDPMTKLSDAPCVRRPDVLMELQLQARGQMVGEDPLRERAGFELAVDGRHQHGGGAIGERIAGDYVASELVVGSILDDELDLVPRREPVQIRPVGLAGFTAAWTFDVDNFQDAGRDPGDRTMASSLKHYGAAAAAQTLHQLVYIFLKEWFAACDLDQRTAIALYGRHHLVQRHPPPFVEGVRRIAPGTAQVARGQTYEDARLSGPRRLTLNRVEDLVDRQHPLSFYE
jgi:hypothetical protein